MQPPVDEAGVCKHCGKTFLRSYHPSGNTIGARFFTDGRIVGPMYPFHDEPMFARCPHCGGLFWIEEQKAAPSSWKIRNLLKDIPRCLPIEEISDMFVFLNSGEAADKKREFPVRKRIWWKYNDRIRLNFNSPAAKPWSSSDFDGIVTKSREDYELWQNNLVRLMRLVEKIKPEEPEYLLITEINRNLGNFELAAAILEKHASDEYDAARKSILEGCKQRDRYVRML